VVDELDVGARLAAAERHREGIEDEVGAHAGGELPADDHSAVGVEHEGEEDDAFPAAQVGDVGDPQLVRAAGAEVALDEIGPRLRLRVGFGGRPRLPRRFAPTTPWARISRCTRPRPACSPARRSASHIRR